MSSASDISHPIHEFSVIEIDSNKYYIASLHIDDCIMNYSHTMSTALLETFTSYSDAHTLSNQKIITVVFENIPLPPSAPEQIHPPEKKVVGLWHPQLTRFILHNA
jgi:hypothetical protein